MTRARDRAAGAFTGQQIQAQVVSDSSAVTVNSATATTLASVSIRII